LLFLKNNLFPNPASLVPFQNLAELSAGMVLAFGEAGCVATRPNGPGGAEENHSLEWLAVF